MRIVSVSRSTFAGARPLPVLGGTLTEGDICYRGAFTLDDELFDQLLRQWAIEDRGFETLYRTFRDQSGEDEPSSNFYEFWRTNPSALSRLTARQKSFSRCGNRAVTLQSFTFDGVTFKPFDPQVKYDNSYVAVRYQDVDDGPSLCYGRIKKIFKHRLTGQRCNEEVSDVFIECEWFSKVGVQDLTGLTRVTPNPNFDSARLAFAKHVLPASLSLREVDPFADHCNEFVVIVQRDRELERYE